MRLDTTNLLQRNEKPVIKMSISQLSRIHELRENIMGSIEKHHKKPSIVNDFPDLGLKVEQEILTDVVTFVELKLNKGNQSIIQNIKRENFIGDLCKAFRKKRINFSDGVLEASKLLRIQNPPDYSLLIYQNPEFLKDKIRLTELELFLNKGNFHWTTFDRSEFSGFLNNKEKTKLSPSSRINCWEAMLYSLIRSGALAKEDVAKLYDPKLKFYESLEKLSRAFRWNTSKNMVDKELFKKTCSHVPYFIEISSKGSMYLAGPTHDMISFPNSNAKILKTLIDGKYSDDTDNKMSVYSHWNRYTDSRIGVADQNEILRLIDTNEVHIIPLSVFVKKFPKEPINNDSRT